MWTTSTIVTTLIQVDAKPTWISVEEVVAVAGDGPFDTTQIYLKSGAVIGCSNDVEYVMDLIAKAYKNRSAT